MSLTKPYARELNMPTSYRTKKSPAALAPIALKAKTLLALYQQHKNIHLALHRLSEMPDKKQQTLINQQTSAGQTLFFLACQQGDMRTVKKLLANKHTDIHLADNDGTTPFMTAFKQGHTKICELLLEGEANAENLLTLARLGSTQEVKAMLDVLRHNPHENKDIINTQHVRRSGGHGFYRYTALQMAIANQHKTIALALIAQPDIDLNHQDIDGSTALLLALETRQPKVAMALLRHKTIDVNLARTQYFGVSALPITEAAKHGDLPVTAFKYLAQLSLLPLCKENPALYLQTLEKTCDLIQYHDKYKDYQQILDNIASNLAQDYRQTLAPFTNNENTPSLTMIDSLAHAFAQTLSFDGASSSSSDKPNANKMGSNTPLSPLDTNKTLHKGSDNLPKHPWQRRGSPLLFSSQASPMSMGSPLHTPGSPMSIASPLSSLDSPMIIGSPVIRRASPLGGPPTSSSSASSSLLSMPFTPR